MEAKELRNMSVDELKNKLEELKKEHFNLRFQSAVQGIKNINRMKQLRREIARVLTVLREKGVKL